MANQAYGFTAASQAALSPQNALAQTAMGLGGAAILPQVQRSEMLAQALQNLQQTGGQNLRTPLALGSNLLADALLTYGRNKANKGLMQSIQANQNAAINGQQVPGEADYLASQAGGSGSPAAGVGGLGAGPIPSPAGAPGAGGGQNAPGQPMPDPSAAPAPSVPPTIPQAAPVTASADPRTRMLADLVAGGLSPTAAAGMVGNFTQESGPQLNRDNPAEGAIGVANWRGGRAQAAQDYWNQHGGPTIDNQAQYVLQELHGPEGATLARLNAAQDPASAAAAAAGYERPAGWTPGGDPALISGWANRLAQTQALAQQQGGAGASPAQTQGQPYQVAANGQTPGPPQASSWPVGVGLGSGLPGAMPPGSNPRVAPAPPPAQGQGQSQGPSQGWGQSAGAPGGQPSASQGAGVTPQPFPVQPAQFQRLEQLRALAMRQPQLYAQQFMDYRNELQTQASTPEQLEISRPNDAGQITITGKSSGRIYGIQNVPGSITTAGPKMIMGPNGQPTLLQGTGVQQLPSAAPGVETQRDMTGRITNEAIPNAVQSGQAWNPQTGSYQPLRGLQPTVTGTPAPGTVVSQTPGQAPTVVQAPPYTPQDVIAQRNAFKSGDAYKSYVNTASALNSLGSILQQATGNNGVVDMSAFDNLIRAQTGLSARQGNMAMMMEHLGFPAEAAGMVNNIAGNGFTTPDQIANAYRALRAYTTTHGQIAQHELDQESAIAKRGGQDFGITLPPLQTAPNVPWMGASNPAGGGGGQSVGAQRIATGQAALSPPAPANQPIPMNQRVPGRVYPTPRGPAMWTGAGWQLQGGQ